MYAHLTGSAELPPSQVLRPEVELEGTGMGDTNLVLPEVAATPGDADLISVENGHVTVPD